MAKRDIDGIKIPDSQMAREVMQLVHDTENELLFKHSTRVYFWAALTGRRTGVIYDPELLFAAAMFHDFGLTSVYQESRFRFEVDGANAARAFLRTKSILETDVEKVWTAIAFDTTPGIPDHMHAEAALLQAGAGMDVAGRGYDQFTEDQLNAVTSAYPRGDQFSHEMIQAFYDGVKHRPDTTFGTFNDDFIAFKDPTFKRLDLCSIILASPWNTDERPRKNERI